jgi:gluconokinase
MIILLMGVAGSGKTTIGRRLAVDLSWRFYDADDFHPPANVAKMAAGTPLTDADRGPWLQALRNRIETSLATSENAIVACSALKSTYRAILHPRASEPVHFVYLRGTPELLAERLAGRTNHFMKPAMLASQLSALEEPANAIIADIAQPPEQPRPSLKNASDIHPPTHGLIPRPRLDAHRRPPLCLAPILPRPRRPRALARPLRRVVHLAAQS